MTFSCKDKKPGTLIYSRLQYDTSILKLFDWDTSKYEFPENSDPLPLDQEDIAIADSILSVAVDSFNKDKSPGLYKSFDKRIPIDIFIIDLKKYKRQYLPYRDVNGQKIISIYAFCDKYSSWQTKVYSGRLYGGICYLQLKVNLSEKTFDYLKIGGYG